MPGGGKHRFLDRELSWLAFSQRVLNEARDVTVPLYERITFLAIVSSNLDEFFRVRVAGLRTLLPLKKKTLKSLSVEPSGLLRKIRQEVDRQQEQFGSIWKDSIQPELHKIGVRIIDPGEITPGESDFLRRHFRDVIQPHIQVLQSSTLRESPFLKNRQVYLAVETGGGDDGIALLSVPSPPLPRFVTMPQEEGVLRVIYLDDIIRLNLSSLLPAWSGDSYAVKLTRDSELYLEDEFDGSISEQIRKGLERRENGRPCRFLFDAAMPVRLRRRLMRWLNISRDDLVRGGRYHNLHDLGSLPQPPQPSVRYERREPLAIPGFEESESMFDAIGQSDHLLQLPYQSFHYVIRLLDEAASDPGVERIWITLYRAANDSQVVEALVRAAAAGKHVTAVVELKARFDEAANLDWADAMQEAGVEVIYSPRDLKVHAKLLQIRRREGDSARHYAYLSTGNFNEKTARLYTDCGLFTADSRLTADVSRVFDFLTGKTHRLKTKYLMVAPFNMRKRLNRLIREEARAAAEGQDSGIRMKMNSLEDMRMIRRLCNAVDAGVPVRLIVRGICCISPAKDSPDLEIRSIIDRYLEHTRVYVFRQNGEDRMYLSSADMMSRNLDRRVEVAFPVLDEAVRYQIDAMLSLQLKDNVKARVLFASRGLKRDANGKAIRCQFEAYDLVEETGLRRPSVIEEPVESGGEG